MTILDVVQVTSVLSSLEVSLGMVVASNPEGLMDIYTMQIEVPEISIQVEIVQSIDSA